MKMKKIIIAFGLFCSIATPAKTLEEYGNMKMSEFDSFSEELKKLQSELSKIYNYESKEISEYLKNARKQCNMVSIQSNSKDIPDQSSCDKTVSEVIKPVIDKITPVKLKTLDEYGKMTLAEFFSTEKYLYGFNKAIQEEYGPGIIATTMDNLIWRLGDTFSENIKKCNNIEKHPKRMRAKIEEICSNMNRMTMSEVFIEPVEEEAKKRGWL